MFSFWVNDTTIFPVTQAWHLHTMPALITVKYSFDYFTPFKNIPWQFFSLECKLPQPAFLTLFSPSSSACHLLLSEHNCQGPSGPRACFRHHPLAPQSLMSIYLSFSWKKTTCMKLLIPFSSSRLLFFQLWCWIEHFHLLKSLHSLSKNFIWGKKCEGFLFLILH